MYLAVDGTGQRYNTKQGCRLGQCRTEHGHVHSPKPDQAAVIQPGVKWAGGRKERTNE